MKVGVFEVQDWERGALERLDVDEVLFSSAECDRGIEGPISQVDVISCFVQSRLTKECLQAFPNLKFIATRSTGFDHIDVEYCHEQAIPVSNVPGYGDVTVAEHSFALLLALSRRLIPAIESTRRGIFSDASFRGFDLRGRTLGLIGVGQIGRRAMEIGRGFGMKLLAYDAQPDASAAASLGFSYVSLSKLLSDSDVISLHVPANASTRNLISDAQFDAMKPSAILINTARGDVVDTNAMIRALKSGRLAGAGLDVLPNENLLRDEAEIFRTDHSFSEVQSLLASNILLQMPNVIVTPHIAYNTEDAVNRILMATVDNIQAFVDGAPRNLV